MKMHFRSIITALVTSALTATLLMAAEADLPPKALEWFQGQLNQGILHDKDLRSMELAIDQYETKYKNVDWSTWQCKYWIETTKDTAYLDSQFKENVITDLKAAEIPFVNFEDFGTRTFKRVPGLKKVNKCKDDACWKKYIDDMIYEGRRNALPNIEIIYLPGTEAAFQHTLDYVNKLRENGKPGEYIVRPTSALELKDGWDSVFKVTPRMDEKQLYPSWASDYHYGVININCKSLTTIQNEIDQKNKDDLNHLSQKRSNQAQQEYSDANQILNQNRAHLQDAVDELNRLKTKAKVLIDQTNPNDLLNDQKAIDDDANRRRRERNKGVNDLIEGFKADAKEKQSRHQKRVRDRIHGIKQKMEEDRLEAIRKQQEDVERRRKKNKPVKEENENIIEDNVKRKKLPPPDEEKKKDLNVVPNNDPIPPKEEPVIQKKIIIPDNNPKVDPIKHHEDKKEKEKTHRTKTPKVKPPPKIPPVAQAGPDQSIEFPANSLTIIGNGKDEDGQIVSYQWKQITDKQIPTPATRAVLLNQNTPNLKASNLTEGRYLFKLTVTDNDGLTGEDIMMVTVIKKHPPIANAGGDQRLIPPNYQTTLYGSGHDSDGQIVSYKWEKISGGKGNVNHPDQPQLSLDGMEVGVYQFKLTVTDNDGLTGEDTMTLTIAKSPPIANAGEDQTLQDNQDKAEMHGSGKDLDGVVVSYQWTQVIDKKNPLAKQAKMENANTPDLKVSGLTKGNYTFKLTVTDNDGLKGEDTMQLVIPEPPKKQPPVADAGPDKTIQLPQNNVEVVGKGTDPDGTVVSYRWEQVFGDKKYPAPTAATLTDADKATFKAENLTVPGTYMFKLTVTDNDGLTGEDTMLVIIKAAATPTPTPVPPHDKHPKTPHSFNPFGFLKHKHKKDDDTPQSSEEDPNVTPRLKKKKIKKEKNTPSEQDEHILKDKEKVEVNPDDIKKSKEKPNVVRTIEREVPNQKPNVDPEEKAQQKKEPEPNGKPSNSRVKVPREKKNAPNKNEKTSKNVQKKPDDRFEKEREEGIRARKEQVKIAKDKEKQHKLQLKTASKTRTLKIKEKFKDRVHLEKLRVQKIKDEKEVKERKTKEEESVKLQEIKKTEKRIHTLKKKERSRKLVILDIPENNPKKREFKDTGVNLNQLKRQERRKNRRSCRARDNGECPNEQERIIYPPTPRPAKTH